MWWDARVFDNRSHRHTRAQSGEVKWLGPVSAKKKKKKVKEMYQKKKADFFSDPKRVPAVLILMHLIKDEAKEIRVKQWTLGYRFQDSHGGPKQFNVGK